MRCKLKNIRLRGLKMTDEPKILDNKFKIGEKVWSVPRFYGNNLAVRSFLVESIRLTRPDEIDVPTISYGLISELEMMGTYHTVEPFIFKSSQDANAYLINYMENEYQREIKAINDKYDRMRKEADE